MTVLTCGDVWYTVPSLLHLSVYLLFAATQRVAPRGLCYSFRSTVSCVIDAACGLCYTLLSIFCFAATQRAALRS
jgi:hypothetical protein